MVAAFLTILTRILTRPRNVPRTGIGHPPPSAVRSHLIILIRLILNRPAVDIIMAIGSVGLLVHPAAGTTISGLMRRAAVFLGADPIRILNPRQENNALLRTGHGAKTTAAVFLTSLARITILPLSVPRHGIGQRTISAANLTTLNHPTMRTRSAT